MARTQPKNTEELLESAQTFRQLWRTARDAQVEALAVPFAAVALDPNASRALARWVVSSHTLGDFLRSDGVLGLDPATSSRVLESIRAHLIAGLRTQQERAARPAEPSLESDPQGWAVRHGVADALDVRVDSAKSLALEPGDYDAAWRSIGEILTGKTSYGRKAWRPGLVDAARAWVRAEAADAGQALRDERELLAKPLPVHPALRQAAESLRSTRTLVRADVTPRTLASMGRDDGRVEIGGDPAAAWWIAGGVKAFVPLAPGEMPACSCVRPDSHDYRMRRAERTPFCRHMLAAIDAALLAMNVEEDRDEIAAELMRPGWGRLFQHIDELAKKRERRDAADRPAQRIEWRVTSAEWAGAYVMPSISTQMKRGGWGSPKERAWEFLLRKGMPELPPEDARVLDAVRALPRGKWSHFDPAFTRTALFALAGHPRVVLEGGIPAQVVEERVGIAARESADGGATLELRLGTEPVEAAALVKEIAPPGNPKRVEFLVRIDRKAKRVRLFRVDDAAFALVAGIARWGGAIPAEAMAELEKRLGAIERLVPLELSETLRGTEVPADPRVVVVLAAGESGALEVALRVRPARGGPALVPGAGDPIAKGTDARERWFARRDFAAEVERAKAFVESVKLPLLAQYAPFEVELDRGIEEGALPEQSLDLLAALRGREDAVVEWLRGEAKLTRIAAKNLRVVIESKKDWFGVNGTAKVDGETLEIAELLAAVRGGAKFVRVKDGVWAEIEAALRARLRAVTDATSVEKGATVARRGAIWAVQDLAGDVERFDAAPAWLALGRKMTEAERMAPPVPPLRDDVTLRDYQHDGYAWMAKLAAWGAGGILADDMGLGKTAQALALLAARTGEGPALVLAPTSVCSNWRAEAARFAPGLSVALYRENRTLDGLKAGDVLVVSYGLLAREAEKFAEKRFATLIIDEAQQVKNAATTRARAVRDLSADVRFALSGTPIENHLGELWSLFRIVFPELLGSLEQFRDRFAIPIERNRDPDGERRAALAKIIRPFLLRRRKEEVARELPARTVVDEVVELSAPERALYEAERMRSLNLLEDEEEGAGKNRAGRSGRGRIEILAALTRLRLLACNPRLGDDACEVPSSKLERFLELFEEIAENGHRALVFSQFTSHLALVRDALSAKNVRFLYLDGKTPPAERDRLVAAFQRGESPVFLISLKAGGAGINLTAADYIFHLDPWWNPAVEDQATDRAHRIGQTQPVTVLRLIAKGTIEEGILSLHADKRALVEGVLAGTDAATRLTDSDILALLRNR